MMLLLSYITGNDYRIHFWYMSKHDAISIMNNSSLDEKRGVFFFFFFHYIENELNNLLSKKQRSDFKESKRLLYK